METNRSSTQPEREQLRQRWMANAAAAFELMFGDAQQKQLVTLTQREERACQMAQDLAVWLLEQHVTADSAAQPEPDQVCCPKCQRPARRVTQSDTTPPDTPQSDTPQSNTPPPDALHSDAAPPGRLVTTLAGEIEFAREQWRCPRCRIFFFPLDEKLQLGTEGYSPQVLKKAVRQASKASFEEASADLRELAGISISPAHLERLSERIGSEWADVRDAEVGAFRVRQLPRAVTHVAPVAAVMLDGGRVRIRADDSPRGVHEPQWHETKVACCLSLSGRVHAVDPQPEPPSKLLDPPQVVRLAAEFKARGGAAAATERRRTTTPDKKQRQRRRKHRRRRAATKRLRTVVATTLASEPFGWQVAAEVQRRGLDRADRKACVCDGQKYNWTIFDLHLLPLGFVAILDFLHLVVYLYAASHVVWPKGSVAAWELYERWLRWAWSGQVDQLITALRAASERLGAPPPRAAEDDPRAIVAEALHYVENNRARMDYPRYRRLGLPISSAPVESLIKQLNRRIKGSEKFWLCGGAEKILQLRAAYLSEDDRAERLWSHPRPRRRSVGQHRLRAA